MNYVSGTSMLTVVWFIILGNQAMATNRCDLLAMAESSIAKMYPTFDLKEFKQIVAEDGNLWRLTYEMPSNMLGGAPIVTIDKRTCKVVRIIHTQ